MNLEARVAFCKMNLVEAWEQNKPEPSKLKVDGGME